MLSGYFAAQKKSNFERRLSLSRGPKAVLLRLAKFLLEALRICTDKYTNNIHLLTGYEGNSTFIVPMVPTIFRGNASENRWYRGDN
jgi:hypothetical protein